MLRFLFAILLAAGLGAAAGNATMIQLFDEVGLAEIWERLDDRGLAFAAVVAAPVVFLLVRGFVGWLITVAIVAGAIVLALRVGLQDDAPLEQIAALAGAYSVVGVTVYRVIILRILG